MSTTLRTHPKRSKAQRPVLAGESFDEAIDRQSHEDRHARVFYLASGHTGWVVSADGDSVIASFGHDGAARTFDLAPDEAFQLVRDLLDAIYRTDDDTFAPNTRFQACRGLASALDADLRGMAAF